MEAHEFYPDLEASKIQGPLFGRPYKKDHRVLGSILRALMEMFMLEGLGFGGLRWPVLVQAAQ